MKTYSFKDINNVYILGDCHGEFKTYFHDIKMGLNVKSEDEDKLHPKEAERRARKAAREEAMLRAQLEGRGRRGLRYPNPGIYGNITISNDTPKKMFKKGKSSTFSNSLFIMAGDCGIGFNKPKYYDDLFEKFNKVLSYNNTFIIMVRGNHDDPAYFDGEQINLSNIKAVPDYSVISVKDKNILCVGGAISLDRTWRIKQEERINRFSISNKKSIYWKNEAPVFDSNSLDKITKAFKIDYVVSHTAPSFVNPEKHNGIDEWSVDDANLISDITEERRVLDKVFETLRDCNMRPKYWAYGHFDMNFIERRSDTIFRCLGDGFNPVSIDMDITSFIYNEENSKRKGKEKKVSLKKLDYDGAIFDLEPPHVEQRNDGFLVEPIVANDDERGDVAEEEVDAPDGIEEIGGEEVAFDDAAFNEYVNNANNNVRGGEVAEPQNVANENEAGEMLGRPVNFDDLQRQNLYERIRREMQETQERYRGVWDNPGAAYYTVANGTNAFTTAINAVNDVTFAANTIDGNLNHADNG